MERTRRSSGEKFPAQLARVPLAAPFPDPMIDPAVALASMAPAPDRQGQPLPPWTSGAWNPVRHPPLHRLVDGLRRDQNRHGHIKRASGADVERDGRCGRLIGKFREQQKIDLPECVVKALQGAAHPLDGLSQSLSPPCTPPL